MQGERVFDLGLSETLRPERVFDLGRFWSQRDAKTREGDKISERKGTGGTRFE